jgi:hypothetical protein
MNGRTPEMYWHSRGISGMRSTDAIVRRELLTAVGRLAPGSVVCVSDLAFEGTGGPRFPATMKDNPDPLMWLTPQDLLPAKEFLHRQPFEEFWTLVLRPRRARRRRGRFLSDPWTQRFGTEPFRFESLGEVVYYVRNSRLRTSDLQAGHFNGLGQTRPQSSGLPANP